jgi:hypothetical protein
MHQRQPNLENKLYGSASVISGHDLSKKNRNGAGGDRGTADRFEPVARLPCMSIWAGRRGPSECGCSCLGSIL